MRIRNHLLTAFALLSALAAAARGQQDSAAVAAQSPKYAGQIIKAVGIDPQFGARVPLDAEFVDADGERMRLGDCFGELPVILHLVYYECPMLCKLSSDGLLSTLSVLPLKPGKDFTIVTISFDPREGPKLSASARDMAIARCGKEAVDNGWHFLTGDEASINAVTEAVGFRYEWDENTKQYAHAAGLFVLTKNGTLSRYIGGINFAPRDLRFALVEASDGKVGTFTDQVLMLCYMYNPSVGRYGFAIITIIRAAGILTVVTLATAIVLMIRRERRGQAAQPQQETLETD
jgi:protein SCO1/2